MKLVFMILSMLLASGFIQNPDHTITVNVIGVANTSGTILINLYNTSVGFPTNMSKAIQSKKIPASTSSAQVSFKVQNGIYAISVMHDENNNGKMDKNFFGIPTEGYCVSNNAKGIMSAPSFSDAKFELKTNIIQTLKLIY
jgi:uncharacterized protein (DUF2141 family)